MWVGKASVLVAGWWMVEMVTASDHRFSREGLRKKLRAARGGQLLIEKSMRSCQMMALGCSVG